jgi:hypothetical protein
MRGLQGYLKRPRRVQVSDTIRQRKLQICSDVLGKIFGLRNVSQPRPQHAGAVARRRKSRWKLPSRIIRFRSTDIRKCLPIEQSAVYERA